MTDDELLRQARERAFEYSLLQDADQALPPGSRDVADAGDVAELARGQELAREIGESTVADLGVYVPPKVGSGPPEWREVQVLAKDADSFAQRAMAAGALAVYQLLAGDWIQIR